MLRAIVGDMLRPAVVKALIDGVFEALQPTAAEADVKVVRAHLRAVDAKITKLTAAIQNGAAVAPIVSQLERRQKEREG